MAADRALAQSLAAVPLAYTGRLNQDIWIAGNSRAIKSINAKQISNSTDSTAINLGVNVFALLYSMRSYEILWPIIECLSDWCSKSAI